MRSAGTTAALGGLSWAAGGRVTAGTYGQLINTAVALHRFDLFKALHLPLPSTAQEERVTYRQLQLLLRNRLADPTTFEHLDWLPSARQRSTPGAAGRTQHLIDNVKVECFAVIDDLGRAAACLTRQDFKVAPVS